MFVYLATGSAIWLGVLTALATLPHVLAGPFMPIVDRYPRRTVMIAGDILAAIGPIVADFDTISHLYRRTTAR